jgi:flagellar motor switch protein FliM
MASNVDNVKVEISVVLGRSVIPMHQLLRMGRGAVIELDSHQDDPVTILANDKPWPGGNPDPGRQDRRFGGRPAQGYDNT